MCHVQLGFGILFVKLNKVLHSKNTLCTLCLRVWVFHAIPALFVISCKVPRLGALLSLSSYKSHSWWRHTCTNVLLVCEAEIGELVQPGGIWGLPWGLPCGTSGRKELCMVPCHTCHIFMGFGQVGTQMFGGCLNVISWGSRCRSKNGHSFHREGRFSQCNNAVLWNFIDWYIEEFIRYLFSLYYCCFMYLGLARLKLQLKVS